MRIEAGGHEDELGPMLVERRQPMIAHGGAKLIAAAAGRQRNVDHFRVVVVQPAIWVQRMLER